MMIVITKNQLQSHKETLEHFLAYYINNSAPSIVIKRWKKPTLNLIDIIPI